MNCIAQNLLSIREGVDRACRRSGREPEEVQLVAVSKTFPSEAVRDALESGHLVYGESRLQEAESKIADLPDTIEWHFIGRVQRNKVRKILPLFDVIHGIDSTKLANYTDRIAEELRLKPKVFLQVNIGEEESKGGFAPGELIECAGELIQLKSLDIKGLMCIPPVGSDSESARIWFKKLAELKSRLEDRYQIKWPHLSMGMSSDYEVAIEEGATHVRVGSAIFGAREYRVEGELG